MKKINKNKTFTTVKEAIEDIRKGKFLIVVDDKNRENEGDLIIAAERLTPEVINFMTKQARGLICVAMTIQRLEELKLPLMVERNTSLHKTNFTVSVDAKKGVTTGISAYDRALTIKKLIDSRTKPEDLAKPGHIFPLKACEGGVLVRAGHTEAAVDLAKLAGLYPAGVICEIIKSDGRMARLPQLKIIAKRFNLKILTIADLIFYRRSREKLVKKVSKAKLPTRYGEFTIIAYKSLTDSEEHIALVKGKINKKEPILVRVHSQCLTGDVFNSLRCDCGDQLNKALEIISREGRGIFLYMRQEGRGIGLHNKIKAYALQDKGLDTVEANKALGFPPDLRDYGIGAQILRDLGVRQMKLLTNNPKKVIGLEAYGLKIVEILPLVVPPRVENINYLKTKKEKLGHFFNF